MIYLLACCLTETAATSPSRRSAINLYSFKGARSARPSFCSGLSRLRTRSSDVPSASLGGLARAAAGRRHSCAMVGQHRPASPGWRRRRGAAHPASGRLVRPRRMPPTMGSRLGVRGLGPLTLRDVDGSGGRAAKEEGSGGAVSSGRCPPRDASGFSGGEVGPRGCCGGRSRWRRRGAAGRAIW